MPSGQVNAVTLLCGVELLKDVNNCQIPVRREDDDIVVPPNMVSGWKVSRA